MGREIKRVPINFNWPLNKVWEGFINPHYVKCPDCIAGYSPEYDIVHGYISKLLWDTGATSNPVVATITTFLAGRAPRDGIFGHDSIDSYSAAKKLGELANLPKNWYVCKTCKGAAVHASAKKAYNSWTPKHPPKGPGWQVWETVSEGSPVSPVFADRDALIVWLIAQGYSHAAAVNFTDGGWAPSMVITGGTLKQDIEACADMPPK